MPEAQAQSSTLATTVELETGVRLWGELSILPDGSLQLGSTRLIGETAAGDKVRLRPGTEARLFLDRGRADKEEDDDGVKVRLTDISGQTLTLDFMDASSAQAQSCLSAVISDTLDAAAPGLTAASAEYSVLLGQLRQHSLVPLQQQLPTLFQDLSSYLLDLSSRIRQPRSGENLHYDASMVIKRNAREIAGEMLQKITEHYLDLTPKHEELHLWRHDTEDADDLKLIDIEEFEGFLAIDRMITFGTDLHNVALEAMLIRLAILIDADPLKVRLPVHVRQLCRAFQQALGKQDLHPEIVPHIYDFFARNFVRKLGAYYSSLNGLLSEGSIRPNIEQEIRAKGTLLEAREKLHRPGPKPRPEHVEQQLGEHPGAADQDSAQQVPRSAGQEVSQERLYNSVIDALNFKRQAEGLGDSAAMDSGAALSGTWEGATVASTDLDQQRVVDARSISRVLDRLQQDSTVRAAIQQSDSLREYLATNREEISELSDSSGLTAESLNQLDMVDNLFGTIKSQLDVASELRPTLGNLQIPLAKLALLDPHFFQDRGHIARSVVEKLSHLSTSANFPNRALENRIEAVVEQIVNDYQQDSSVFQTALDKLDVLVAQQERALSRNIERVVRIEEGQQKLQHAQEAVNEAVSERIKPPQAPAVLMDLMNSGWRDLLILTHIQQGPDSEAWLEQINALDQFCLWLDEQHRGVVDEDLMLLRSVEAESLINLVGEQIADALPTNVAHENVLLELRDILEGNREVSMAEFEDTLPDSGSSPEEIRSRIESLPRLRRWVQRVEQLQADTWLSYHDKDDKKHRMRLAWIGEDKDRYIFVNERGQKIADLSAIQLARQLSRGVQPPAPADKLSVVDKSMYHTLEHVQKTLSFDRNHDSLTKLINRDTFVSQVERALRNAQLKHASHAVMCLNVDQFSLVNDVYDRVNGDQVLIEFARLLAQLHGKKSSSARMEADEFGVLLLDRTMEQAMATAEKIRGDIEAGSVEIEGEKVSFTVSIGVAPIVDYSAGVEQVLEAARSAMHAAKQQGRNKAVQFEEDQEDKGQYRKERSRTRQDLEQALATERFVLRGQAIVQTAINGRESASRHYEVLLGLANKDGSLSSPEEFIKSAERYGFMSLVDRWVVQQAFSWISHLMDSQKVVPHLSINLSGNSVTDDSFVDYLLEQISEFGVGTSRICFEITETGTISSLVKAADFVRTFRNIGCKFSIDDFGTGLASHNYLRELPVDYVKIDGVFVRNIHKNRNDYAMARSINDLAHFLGQETIAESVENEKIVTTLQEIGVDYLQGWGIGSPMLLADIADELSSIEK